MSTPHIIIGTVASDSHMWNLVYLDLALRELGCTTQVLPVCTQAAHYLDAARAQAPDLVLVSTVNGHGVSDAVRLADRLRTAPELASVPFAVGGKLTTSGRLPDDDQARLDDAGYAFVEQADETSDTPAELRRIVREIARTADEREHPHARSSR
ncbi:cobalamin B12-binding domain-containing protein [Streptomyces sp. NPDC088785]|uniref:cobalamin B12-binding domain-containing protein n=1 Tax=Streptomyces sp. NPDC088785 TaxID=3365897 RepID=UPI003823C9A3